jgi:hypothetical protein
MDVLCGRREGQSVMLSVLGFDPAALMVGLGNPKTAAAAVGSIESLPERMLAAHGALDRKALEEIHRGLFALAEFVRRVEAAAQQLCGARGAAVWPKAGGRRQWL